MSFAQKTAVITGASRGIGRQLVLSLAEAGAKVVFAARRPEPLEALARDLRASGAEVVGLQADVGVEDDCERLIETAVRTFGGVDILVNNAGISGVQKPVWALTVAEIDEVMRVNLYGAFACIRFAAPHMIARASGAIVNIGSFTGKRPALNRTAYATSKMALVGLTRTVALELAPHGVRCNVISPGPVVGERVEEVIGAISSSQQRSPEEAREMILAWSPMRQMVTEDEICAMVHFLCADSGRHMTGQDINMTAGIVMS